MSVHTELKNLMNKVSFINIIIIQGMYQTHWMNTAQRVYKYLTCVYNLKVGCRVAYTNMLKTNLLLCVIKFNILVYRRYENAVNYKVVELINLIDS